MNRSAAERVELLGNPVSSGLKQELLSADVLGPQTLSAWKIEEGM